MGLFSIRFQGRRLNRHQAEEVLRRMEEHIRYVESENEYYKTAREEATKRERIAREIIRDLKSQRS